MGDMAGREEGRQEGCVALRAVVSTQEHARGALFEAVEPG